MAGNDIMNTELKSLRDAVALMARACRAAAPFFLSIELWLMVTAAVATVAGVWLTALADPRALVAFAFAGGYPALRVTLHRKRILSWPYM